MFIPKSTIQISSGRVSYIEPAPVSIPYDPVEAAAFAAEADREAEDRFAIGDFIGADRWTVAALTARARATGARA